MSFQPMKKAQLGKLIGRIQKSANTLRENVQEAAVQCIYQRKHNNLTHAQRLIEAMGPAMQAVLVRYLCDFGAMSYNSETGKLSLKKNGVVELDVAAAQNWWEYAKESKAQTPLDIARARKLFRNLLARITDSLTEEELDTFEELIANSSSLTDLKVHLSDDSGNNRTAAPQSSEPAQEQAQAAA